MPSWQALVPIVDPTSEVPPGCRKPPTLRKKSRDVSYKQQGYRML